MKSFLLGIFERVAGFLAAFFIGYTRKEKEIVEDALKNEQVRNDVEDDVSKLDNDTKRKRLRKWVRGFQTDKTD